MNNPVPNWLQILHTLTFVGSFSFHRLVHRHFTYRQSSIMHPIVHNNWSIKKNCAILVGSISIDSPDCTMDLTQPSIHPSSVNNSIQWLTSSKAQEWCWFVYVKCKNMDYFVLPVSLDLHSAMERPFSQLMIIEEATPATVHEQLVCRGRTRYRRPWNGFISIRWIIEAPPLAKRMSKAYEMLVFGWFATVKKGTRWLSWSIIDNEWYASVFVDWGHIASSYCWRRDRDIRFWPPGGTRTLLLALLFDLSGPNGPSYLGLD